MLGIADCFSVEKNRTRLTYWPAAQIRRSQTCPNLASEKSEMRQKRKLDQLTDPDNLLVCCSWIGYPCVC